MEKWQQSFPGEVVVLTRINITPNHMRERAHSASFQKTQPHFTTGSGKERRDIDHGHAKVQRNTIKKKRQCLISANADKTWSILCLLSSVRCGWACTSTISQLIPPLHTVYHFRAFKNRPKSLRESGYIQPTRTRHSRFYVCCHLYVVVGHAPRQSHS